MDKDVSAGIHGNDMFLAMDLCPPPPPGATSMLFRKYTIDLLGDP
jgi:hypothetical protein